MKEILRSPYSKIFLAGLLLDILCAWFSTGYFHTDEHFQILEFCNYKLGKLPYSKVPWELTAGVRSTILPWAVYTLIKVLAFIHVSSPFVVMFIVRLLTGIAVWFVSCRMCLLLIPQMKTPKGERLLVFMSMLLWFVPFLNVRFSAENISGLTFLYGVYFILQALYRNSKSAFPYIIAGLFFGLSCFIRIQLSFAVAGLIAWLLLIKKTEWKYFFILCLSSLVTIGINYALDSLFYGTPVFTPLSYFYTNIVQHKAEYFGTSPWWFYIPTYLERTGLPLSVFLLTFFIAGIYKYPKHPLVWMILPFLVLHFFISHKEWRFLFPIATPFVFLSALGLDALLQNKYYLKVHKYVYIISIIAVLPLLAYRAFIPAEATINYYRYLYNNAAGKAPTLFIMHDTADYSMFGLHASFYKSPKIASVYINKIEDMASYMVTNKLDTAYYIDEGKIPFNCDLPGYKKTRVYCLYPDWVLNCNINNWQSRTQILVIYELTKVK